MHPFDVAAPDLSPAISGLRKDPAFLGGAVAVPYKREILPFLDELEEEAEAIGAVNCIYRRGDRLIGGNTDGVAALMSVHRLIPELTGAVVVVLGTGGAGRAVATYLAKAIGSSGTLFLGNRSPQDETFARRLRAYCNCEILSVWPVARDVLEEADLIINTTSIGSDLVHVKEGNSITFGCYTPLGPIGEITPVTSGHCLLRDFSEANHECDRCAS